jgi:2-C-methyl-D-erythritol 4-phosphate cytidylyltransferase
MFQAGVLRRAFAEALMNGVELTDEASAVEAIGQPPLLVQGSPRNFKVTWPEDFDLMERWMS